MQVTWTVLRLKRVPFSRRHILVLPELSDLCFVGGKHLRFEFVIFAFNQADAIKLDTHQYVVQTIKCKDNMRELRYNLKLAFKTSTLGHVYVINEKIPMYAFLKEWYVLNYLEIAQVKPDNFIWEVPHVVVFDLDNTLITDERDVNIRDEFVYESLETLKQMGCVLVLWSYGNKSHVVHSMERTHLLCSYFDVILCGGYKTSYAPARRRVVADASSNLVSVEKSFFLDVDDDRKLPKSPRVVLWYLRKLGVNYIKSITLVDDLKTNDYAYDFFINVRACREPINDWHRYHDEITDNIVVYEHEFAF